MTLVDRRCAASKYILSKYYVNYQDQATILLFWISNFRTFKFLYCQRYDIIIMTRHVI